MSLVLTGLAQRWVLANPEYYRRLIGRHSYLCFIRHELSYCVHILSQFMQWPRQEHSDVAIWVVKYLKGNPWQAFILRSDCDLQLHGSCDFDWKSFSLASRSLTGWFVLLGNSLIYWKTKKQHITSHSSMEAEYHSMVDTTMCELKWLKVLVSSLDIQLSWPIPLVIVVTPPDC